MKMTKDQMSSEDFRKLIGRAKGAGAKATSTNKLTNNIIDYINKVGFVVWRNNTMGVFDGKQTANKLLNYIKIAGMKANLKGIRACFVYRKSHEKKGTSDIIGYQCKTARFVAIEVKVGKDQLSQDQIWFLEEVNRNGGIGIVAKDWDQFIEELEKSIL